MDRHATGVFLVSMAMLAGGPGVAQDTPSIALPGLEAPYMAAVPARLAGGGETRLVLGALVAGARAIPFRTEAAESLRIVHPDGALQPLSIHSLLGSPGAPHVELTRPGSYMAVLALKERLVVAGASRGAVRTWLKGVARVGEPGGDAVSLPVGVPVEIVPEHDPGYLVAGERLAVVLLVEGKPQGGSEITVVHADSFRSRAGDGPPASFRLMTDEAGRAVISVPRPGLWILRHIDQRPAAPGDALVVDGGAAASLDWRRREAVLTFSVSGGLEGGIEALARERKR